MSKKGDDANVESQGGKTNNASKHTYQSEKTETHSREMQDAMEEENRQVE